MLNKKQGKGWHKDSRGHAQAGQKGGKVTAVRYGVEFYRSIGKKGGQKSSGNFKNNPGRASIAGRKGGRARGISASKNINKKSKMK